MHELISEYNLTKGLSQGVKTLGGFESTSEELEQVKKELALLKSSNRSFNQTKSFPHYDPEQTPKEEEIYILPRRYKNLKLVKKENIRKRRLMRKKKTEQKQQQQPSIQ